MTMKLLDELRAAGINVTLEGDRIRVEPASRLTGSLRDRLGQHRSEVVAALRPPPDFPARSEDWPPPLECRKIADRVRIINELSMKLPAKFDLGPGRRVVSRELFLRHLWSRVQAPWCRFDPGDIDNLLELLSERFKASLSHAITPTDTSAGWYQLWDERTAIREYDGGLPHEQAEALGLADVRELMSQVGKAPDCGS